MKMQRSVENTIITLTVRSLKQRSGCLFEGSRKSINVTEYEKVLETPSNCETKKVGGVWVSKLYCYTATEPINTGMPRTHK